MNIDNQKSRRQFLRNVSMGSLSLGIIPGLAKGENIKKNSQIQIEDCERTTLDYYGEGPFYTENPPLIQNNLLANAEEPGRRLVLSGRVHTLDCTQMIADAVIDVWHANDAGQYDNTGYNLRGVTKSNDQGFYLFETIIPGKYLNGNKYRPSHIHFKITAPGFSTLTTQLYFEGDTDIPDDAAASIKSGTYDASHRIISLTQNSEGKYEGKWDIVIDGDGTSGIDDLHLNKGIIYSVSPNPFSENIEIKYGVFRNSRVAISVFDLMGKLVANLEELTLTAEKYTANWEPEPNLQNGTYFISLKINDMHVHYLKATLQR